MGTARCDERRNEGRRQCTILPKLVAMDCMSKTNAQDHQAPAVILLFSNAPSGLGCIHLLCDGGNDG